MINLNPVEKFLMPQNSKSNPKNWAKQTRHFILNKCRDGLTKRSWESWKRFQRNSSKYTSDCPRCLLKTSQTTFGGGLVHFYLHTFGTLNTICPEPSYWTDMTTHKQLIVNCFLTRKTWVGHATSPRHKNSI